MPGIEEGIRDFITNLPPDIKMGAFLGVLNAATYHLVTFFWQQANNRILQKHYIEKMAENSPPSVRELTESYKRGPDGSPLDVSRYQMVNNLVAGANRKDPIGSITTGAALALDIGLGTMGVLSGSPTLLVTGSIGLVFGPGARLAAKVFVNRFLGY